MSNRVITSNASNRLPVEVQLLLWYLADSMKVEKKDYFQVFELTDNNGCQQIRHFQEEPEWEETIILLDRNPIIEKVYIIYDEGVTTMLLAEDY